MKRSHHPQTAAERLKPWAICKTCGQEVAVPCNPATIHFLPLMSRHRNSLGDLCEGSSQPMEKDRIQIPKNWAGK